jgi:hypothetical protein
MELKERDNAAHGERKMEQTVFFFCENDKSQNHQAACDE